jgi:hypothetical protein
VDHRRADYSACSHELAAGNDHIVLRAETGTVMDEIRTFEQTTEQLLRNASYMTVEHKEASGLLRTLFAEFDAGLEDLQERFVGEVERPGKKARFVEAQEGYVEREIK